MSAHAPNRLAAETSLYLKQHANNPVDWFPWGPEALAKAKELDRPIFLSVGYSACHWCHVMEHESFEDVDTAALMNAHFVCIKVDREERPDIDTIYMNALHVLTREGGGWPLSVFLTPDLTPFFAGTYYPPDDRYAAHGRPSFKRLLAEINNAWVNRRDRITEIGRTVTEHLQGMSDMAAGDTAVSPELLFGALNVLRQSYDPKHGGFGTAPKFPHALELRLLLRLSDRFNDPVALEMVKHTLTSMARGGMYDQIGGGFARYSVDAQWLVPHFEKMLYDNALLTSAYVEAFQKTREPLVGGTPRGFPPNPPSCFFEQIARETLDYVQREMTSPDAAFFSTQDADSEGEEGKFYVWSMDGLRKVLGTEDAEFACQVWGVTRSGNFEGHSILFRTLSDADEAKSHGLSLADFQAKLKGVKEKLYDARSKRVWPGRDEKILTAWNGLMIAAFAQAGAAFGEDRYLKSAANAADFILSTMRTPQGRLYRTAGVGQPPKLNAYLEDYAFLADALVTLYEATFEPKWLHAAVDLSEVMLKHFADPSGPGFFFTADDHERLIARTKDLHDGSTPSGNAMAVTALLRLAALTGRPELAEPAERALRGYRETMAEHPAASGQMLAALDFYLGPVQQIVVVGAAGEGKRRALAAIRRAFRSNRVIAYHDRADGAPPAELAALFAGKDAVGGEVTVYVCENFTCLAPLVGAEAVEKAFT